LYIQRIFSSDYEEGYICNYEYSRNGDCKSENGEIPLNCPLVDKELTIKFDKKLYLKNKKDLLEYEIDKYKKNIELLSEANSKKDNEILNNKQEIKNAKDNISKLTERLNKISFLIKESSNE
jgi:hypothetical protein